MVKLKVVTHEVVLVDERLYTIEQTQSIPCKDDMEAHRIHRFINKALACSENSYIVSSKIMAEDNFHVTKVLI